MQGGQITAAGPLAVVNRIEPNATQCRPSALKACLVPMHNCARTWHLTKNGIFGGYPCWGWQAAQNSCLLSTWGLAGCRALQDSAIFYCALLVCGNAQKLDGLQGCWMWEQGESCLATCSGAAKCSACCKLPLTSTWSEFPSQVSPSQALRASQSCDQAAPATLLCSTKEEGLCEWHRKTSQPAVNLAHSPFACLQEEFCNCICETPDLPAGVSCRPYEACSSTCFKPVLICAFECRSAQERHAIDE